MENIDIKPAYGHTKFGTFMFNVCAKWTKFLIKNRWLYYLLACTWGVLMTLLGLLISGVLGIVKIFDKKIKFEKFYWIYDIKVGPDWWGGFECGLNFLRDHKSDDDYINNHEFGHGFQNCLLGPLFIFLVAIPSAARYWYQEIRSKKGKDNKPYDGIWFEDAATQCGSYAVAYIQAKSSEKAAK